MGYVKGQWKAQCQRCGHTFLSRDISQEWTGLRVCRGPGTNDCYDPRHPQDRLRAKADRMSVPWTSPEGEGRDVSPGSGNEITAEDL